MTPCKCGFGDVRIQHICAVVPVKPGPAPVEKPAPVIACECGFWANRIQHVCREASARVIKACKCGFADGSLQHICAVKPLAVQLKEKREALKNPPPRPAHMCQHCPTDKVPCMNCWVRAGHETREYYRTFPEQRPKRERVKVRRTNWHEPPDTLLAPAESEPETLPELPEEAPEAETSERYLTPTDLTGEE